MTNDNIFDDFDTTITAEEAYQEQCNWCNQPLQSATKYAPFCSRKCAEADARDARETEADKWAMRYEM